MKLTWTHSFNKRWHVVWSFKQFWIGFSIEFEYVYIVGLGFLSFYYVGG